MKINLKPQAIEYAINRLLASDPGKVRLRRAGKVCLSVITAVLIMFTIVSTLPGGSKTQIIVGAILSLFGIMFVNDETTKAKMLTTALIAVAAAAAITLGAFIGSNKAVVFGFMLVLVFFAFYLQRFSFRYFAICMAMIIMSYFSTMLGVKTGQLPHYYLGVFVGITVAFLYNFVIFRETPEKLLKQTMKSFHKQVDITLDLLISMVEDDRNDPFRRKSFYKSVNILNDYALSVSDQLDDADIEKLWPGVTVNQLRLYVFDAHMLVGALAQAVRKLKDLHAFERTELRDSWLSLIQAVRNMRILGNPDARENINNTKEILMELRNRLKEVDEEDTRWLYLLRRVVSVTTHLMGEAENLIEKRDRKDEEKEDNNKDDEKQDEENEDSGEKLRPTTKKAIQAFIAGGLSLGVGYLLPISKEFWILLSAFIVLLGAETVGRIFVKSMQRTGGTLLGAIAGFFLANFVSGHTYLEIGLLFVFIFIGFYFVTVSYTVMIFFITMLLAMMYDILMGGISGQLLLMRVVDTTIGVIFGLGVSMLLFPKRTRETVKSETGEFLGELGHYLEVYLKQFTGGPFDSHTLSDKGFTLDQKLQAIKDEVGPLQKSPFSWGKSGLEKRMSTLESLNFYAKHLLAATSRNMSYEINDQAREMISELESRMTDNIEVLQHLIKAGKKRSDAPEVTKVEDLREKIESSPEQITKTSGDDSEDVQKAENALIYDMYFLWRINQRIINLAEEFGAKVVDAVKTEDDRAS